MTPHPVECTSQSGDRVVTTEGPNHRGDLTVTTEAIAPSFDQRAERLLLECGRQESAIYSGQGVPPTEALRFIGTVARLCEALAGITSTDRYEDVAEALDEAL